MYRCKGSYQRYYDPKGFFTEKNTIAWRCLQILTQPIRVKVGQGVKLDAWIKNAWKKLVFWLFELELQMDGIRDA